MSPILRVIYKTGLVYWETLQHVSMPFIYIKRYNNDTSGQWYCWPSYHPAINLNCIGQRWRHKLRVRFSNFTTLHFFSLVSSSKLLIFAVLKLVENMICQNLTTFIMSIAIYSYSLRLTYSYTISRTHPLLTCKNMILVRFYGLVLSLICYLEIKCSNEMQMKSSFICLTLH